MSIFSFVRMLSPDGAIVLASLGLLLIFVEFNRPGRILPASLGLLGLLLALSNLFHHSLQLPAVSAVLAALAMACLNLYRRLPFWLLLPSMASLVAGLRFLVSPRGSGGVHTPVALLCGSVLGAASAVLTRIAYRARRAKALN